jgi:hypothetical protein
MDIKKIIRKVLLEQPDGEAAAPQQPQLTRGQRELLARLTTKWRTEAPDITDEQAMDIFLEYRRILPLIKDESQPPVKSFLYRGNGKYTINDLRDGNKVKINDLLSFLLEFTSFRMKIGDGKEKVDAEIERLNNIFGEDNSKPTDKKIQTSKEMWEGQNNLVIDEGDFRVYSINTREESKRFGYYYQEKLRELVLYNVENKKTPTSVSPWCVASRGQDQRIIQDGKMIINSISNMYTNYRNSFFFYFVIDESKDLFGNRGEYYISTIMARSGGGFMIASMYNGEYNISTDELYKLYPKLNGHLDKLIYNPFDRQKEADDNVPLTILEIINENEGSPNAFWMQGPDEKTAYINAGGQLKNPKSWETMVNELREQYINSIQLHDARQKIGSEEFMRAIIKSGVSWKNKLDRRMKQVGTSGIGYLADDFMKINYGPDFYGKKNESIRIYKNKKSKMYGIYDINEGNWLNKDGIEYDAEFTMRSLPDSEDIFDDDNDKIYIVNEFASPNVKFYTLTDLDDSDYKVYILSEKKYRELKEKLGNDGGQPDFKTDTDIGEQQL